MSFVRELRLWVRCAAAVVRVWPGLVCVLVAVGWFLRPMSLGVVSALVLVLVALRVWALNHPRTYGAVVNPLRGRAWRWRIRGGWANICEECGLSAHGTPRLIRSRVDWPHLQLRVRPAVGQTLVDYERSAEALRLGVGATRVRVQFAGTRDVLLTLTIGDELRAAFDAKPPAAVQMESVEMGRREDGLPWRLAIGPQTLVAGCSGSGKGSVFWSLAFGLAPAVRDGRVQLHGIDLKGGMEIRMGSPLFTTTATNAAEAVVALELLVGLMNERTRRYAGRLRTHEPTLDEPLHVVMIDELAALTAYCTERDLQRRAEQAINLLCSQGRAPGFMVFACLQDPRKEVIPARGLFTQMVGLRLKDLSETSMVLGEVAVLSGALCHRITRDQPGTGYVLPEDGSHPIRVRAGYASDEAIRAVAQKFGTATRIPIVAPEPEEDPRSQRRPRSVG